MTNEKISCLINKSFIILYFLFFVIFCFIRSAHKLAYMRQPIAYSIVETIAFAKVKRFESAG
jgi:hypothetical protein